MDCWPEIGSLGSPAPPPPTGARDAGPKAPDLRRSGRPGARCPWSSSAHGFFATSRRGRRSRRPPPWPDRRSRSRPRPARRSASGRRAGSTSAGWRSARRRTAPAAGAGSGAGFGAGRQAPARRMRTAGRAAPGQPQPVNLADHRAARDAAQLPGHLAGAVAVPPKAGQRRDVLLVPFHDRQPRLSRLAVVSLRPRACKACSSARSILSLLARPGADHAASCRIGVFAMLILC